MDDGTGKAWLQEIDGAPLFAGMEPEVVPQMLQCLGYRINSYKKGRFISMEGEQIQQIGLILKGRVDMIKEDFWGNKTILLRMKQQDIFGETFICGASSMATVSFYAADDVRVLFLPFKRVMHTCARTCSFHHQLIENMVELIANKNLELMKKVEVVTKKTLREKILAYLSQQAQQQSGDYFEIPLGRMELAEYLCADRSALTRELTAMKQEGMLDYDKNVFRLLRSM